MQQVQLSESPIGRDQALIIVQNQTYPISTQTIIQRSGLAQWLHDLKQLLLPRGSLTFINIQSPLTDFETPESARTCPQMLLTLHYVTLEAIQNY